jgi:transposase
MCPFFRIRSYLSQAVLPSKTRGVSRADDRRVLSGMFWALRPGAPWRDLPTVTGRQLGHLPNMIQPPLLGVVNAASAVSARTLTCRAPAVPRS